MNNRTLLVLPYQLARTPLSLIDSQLARRLPTDSRPRIVFDRALGSFDQLAGRWLDNASIAERGTNRVARADKIVTAAQLEQQAADLRGSAKATARQGKQEATAKASQARDKVVGGARAAQATERDGKRAATAAARAKAAREKKQADERAQQRVASAEQSRKNAEASATARATQAKKAAKAKLDDVSTERKNAADTRRDADQLGELATAKRDTRTNS